MHTTYKEQTKRELIQEAVKLAIKGYSDSEIGSIMNRNRSSISRWRKTRFWIEEESLQRSNSNEITKQILEGAEDAIELYKERLERALSDIEELSHKQLQTARIGQETCLNFMKELKINYEKNNNDNDYIADQAKPIKAINELQKSVNDTMKTAIEILKFTTQIESVREFFQHKEILEESDFETEITD